MNDPVRPLTKDIEMTVDGSFLAVKFKGGKEVILPMSSVSHMILQPIVEGKKKD
jgi:hypothetical protein